MCFAKFLNKLKGSQKKKFALLRDTCDVKCLSLMNNTVKIFPDIFIIALNQE